MNKDDDLNDDFDTNPDVELDSEFGEFDQDGDKGTVKDLFKNPAIKIAAVVVALMVIVGAITLFGGSSEQGPASSVASGNDLKEAPGTKELSPEMKQVIEEVNQQKLDEAQRTGASVIPQPTEVGKQELTVPAEETTSEDPLLRWRQMQDERLKAQQAEQQAAPQQAKEDPAKAAALQALSSQMSAQMSQILSGKKIDNLKSMSVTNLQDVLAAKQQQITAANAQAAASQQAGMIDPLTNQPLQQAKILLPAGAIEYGQLLIEANSDIPGPVVALIVSGPFAGSRVLGSFSRQEKFLVIQFNTLVDKKGISIPIQAFALDPDTTLSGMATDVDNRYWERIILPAAAEFIEGVGEAYADKEGDTTIVTGDTVVQSEPSIDYQEQLATGVERAAERAGDVLEEEGDNTEPLVRVRAGTPMGILFMAAITDQDRIASQYNPTTARTLAQEQQQNLLQQQLQQSGQPQSPLYLIQGLQGAQNLQSGQTTPTGTTGSTFNGTIINSTGRNSTVPSNIFSTQQYMNQQN